LAGGDLPKETVRFFAAPAPLLIGTSVFTSACSRSALLEIVAAIKRECQAACQAVSFELAGDDGPAGERRCDDDWPLPMPMPMPAKWLERVGTATWATRTANAQAACDADRRLKTVATSLKNNSVFSEISRASSTSLPR
jgi:hypothetical protein